MNHKKYIPFFVVLIIVSLLSSCIDSGTYVEETTQSSSSALSSSIKSSSAMGVYSSVSDEEENALPSFIKVGVYTLAEIECMDEHGADTVPPVCEKEEEFLRERFYIILILAKNPDGSQPLVYNKLPLVSTPTSIEGVYAARYVTYDFSTSYNIELFYNGKFNDTLINVPYNPNR
jgi:hypothetical protein